MTAQQKEDLLYNIESIWDHYIDYKDRAPELFPGWLKSKLANIRQNITDYSHDYSVIGLREGDSKALFEFNTDSYYDAVEIFKYWRPKIREDAMVIFQDNHETESYIEIHYGTDN